LSLFHRFEHLALYLHKTYVSVRQANRLSVKSTEDTKKFPEIESYLQENWFENSAVALQSFKSKPEKLQRPGPIKYRAVDPVSGESLEYITIPEEMEAEIKKIISMRLLSALPNLTPYACHQCG
jgi:hypothetical protein